MLDDDLDRTASVRYRLAYGHARRIAGRKSRGSGSEAGRGRSLSSIVIEVATLMRCEADETIGEAVRDAVEGRKPGW